MSKPIGIKIVHIGDGAIGKTCLMLRAVYDVFPTKYCPSVFENHSANTALLDDQNRPVSIGFWDTGGGEDYHRLRPLSYPGTSVFVLAFSVDRRESFENITKIWMPEVNHHCPGAHVLLVATKIDLRDDPELLTKLESNGETIISYEEGEKLANDLGLHYVECSSKTGDGITNLYKTVVALGLLYEGGHKRENNKKPSLEDGAMLSSNSSSTSSKGFFNAVGAMFGFGSAGSKQRPKSVLTRRLIKTALDPEEPLLFLEEITDSSCF